MKLIIQVAWLIFIMSMIPDVLYILSISIPFVFITTYIIVSYRDARRYKMGFIEYQRETFIEVMDIIKEEFRRKK